MILFWEDLEILFRAFFLKYKATFCLFAIIHKNLFLKKCEAPTLGFLSVLEKYSKKAIRINF
jgi:hypothetical protein